MTFHSYYYIFTLYFRCVKWYILEKHWYAVPIFQGVITLFVLINFSMATFMDPGVSKTINSKKVRAQISLKP